MKTFLTAVAFLLGMIVSSAWAGTPVPYTEQAFAAAQAAGKPILVHVTAPWCPTCARQRSILSSLEQSPRFAAVVVFNVDFDSQKSVLKAFNVQVQSTLIVFNGKTEKGRSSGVTDAGEITALLQKAKEAG